MKKMIANFLLVFSILIASSTAHADLGKETDTNQIKTGYWEAGEDVHLAVVLNDIVVVSDKFALSISTPVASIIIVMFSFTFAMWVNITGFMMILGRADIPKMLLTLLTGVGIAFILGTMHGSVNTSDTALAEGQTGNLWFDYPYVLIRDFLMGLALEIMIWANEGLSGLNLALPGNAGDFATPAKLFAYAENPILNMALLGFMGLGDSWVTLLPNIVLALLQALPYIFVMCLFGAFMVEAIFKMLAITSLGPLWVYCLFMNWSRSFATSALRIYLSAGLTMVFASLALSFTFVITEKYRAQFICERMGDAKACAISGAQYLEITGDFIEKSYFWTWSYWGMLFFGFVSLLLHLKAPNLASNISGANDSAATAASVVAAGKMTAAMAAKYGSGGIGAIGGSLARNSGASAGIQRANAALRSWQRSGGLTGSGYRLADQIRNGGREAL